MRRCGVLAIAILSVSGMKSGFAAPIERSVDSAECKRYRVPEKPQNCAELQESSVYRCFPYVGCERLSAERVVRATREGRQSGDRSRFERAGISIPSVPPLGTEGRSRTGGHRNPQRENRVSGFYA